MFPTRTARFGVALTLNGPLNMSEPSLVASLFSYSLQACLGLKRHAADLGPIDENCPCPTCAGGMSRAMLHHIITLETAGAHGGSRRPTFPSRVALTCLASSHAA